MFYIRKAPKLSHYNSKALKSDYFLFNANLTQIEFKLHFIWNGAIEPVLNLTLD